MEYIDIIEDNSIPKTSTNNKPKYVQPYISSKIIENTQNEIQLLKTDKETANIYINTMIKEFDELIEERNTLESLLESQDIPIRDTYSKVGVYNNLPRKISNTYEINV
jgi:hypothetical protein